MGKEMGHYHKKIRSDCRKQSNQYFVELQNNTKLFKLKNSIALVSIYVSEFDVAFNYFFFVIYLKS